ncbi:MAG: 4-alpha-glucanotransferase [Chitinispirillaceae bacterium]|nr:4-alpha-glucanotransferase [Chitinispirillaceae bacterium]
MLRGSGVLMHLTSLPSPFGIGNMGPSACRFADTLATAGVRFWQMLPLNPSNPGNGESPYFSASAFAGNPLLISPELLVEDGLLDKSDTAAPHSFPAGEVDYPSVRDSASALLEKAFDRHIRSGSSDEFDRFCKEQAWWLDDFCLFKALVHAHGGKPWSTWPRPLRDRNPDDLRIASTTFARSIERERFVQWLFFSQWFRLRRYCERKKIILIGDLPIYVSLESADVWSNPHLFKLDRAKRPTGVSGVPPDYFSATGQLWNNPVYDWNAMRRNRFDWWEQRFRATFERFDIVRIDHFRGLVQYWEVPADEKTAINGSWQEVPTRAFFDTMIERFGAFPVIAEDLGTITPDVREIMDHYRFPGMKVLMFAFGDDNPDHPYLPHTYEENCIAYTGTHDNQPLRAWFEQKAKPEERERALRYLGDSLPVPEAIWAFVEKLMRSKAGIVIVPLQDLLALDGSCRMNDPGKTFGNWKWRCTRRQLDAVPWERFRNLAVSNGRC